jgi:hypothetical protein
MPDNGWRWNLHGVPRKVLKALTDSGRERMVELGSGGGNGAGGGAREMARSLHARGAARDCFYIQSPTVSKQERERGGTQPARRGAGGLAGRQRGGDLAWMCMGARVSMVLGVCARLGSAAHGTGLRGRAQTTRLWG